MTMKSVPAAVPDLLPPETPMIELRGHSYADYRQVVPSLLDAVAACGCWVLEQRALSPTMTELRLEVQLRSVFELYSGLMSAGVELTRDSHTRMSGLCTVRDHNPRQAKRRRILTIRLELSFLEQGGSEFGASSVGVA
ncbi:MAG TPA: hypothetical protein VIJ38_16525 [Acidobacteriaceae bacterium]